MSNIPAIVFNSKKSTIGISTHILSRQCKSLQVSPIPTELKFIPMKLRSVLLQKAKYPLNEKLTRNAESYSSWEEATNAKIITTIAAVLAIYTTKKHFWQHGQWHTLKLV